MNNPNIVKWMESVSLSLLPLLLCSFSLTEQEIHRQLQEELFWYSTRYKPLQHSITTKMSRKNFHHRAEK